LRAVCAVRHTAPTLTLRRTIASPRVYTWVLALSTKNEAIIFDLLAGTDSRRAHSRPALSRPRLVQNRGVTYLTHPRPGSSTDLEVGMSSGVPAQVGSRAEQRSAGPALLGPTDADLKVSAPYLHG